MSALTDPKPTTLSDTPTPALTDQPFAGTIEDLRFCPALFDNLRDFVEEDIVKKALGWHNSSTPPSPQSLYTGYDEKACK